MFTGKCWHKHYVCRDHFLSHGRHYTHAPPKMYIVELLIMTVQLLVNLVWQF